MSVVSAEREAPGRSGYRGDLLAAAVAVGLVAVAAGVGVYFNRPGSGVVIWAFAPPLYGDWLPHISPATPVVVVFAGLVIAHGPRLASTLAWPRLLGAGYLGAIGWTFGLAMVDGWQRGFAGRLTGGHEYLHEVPGITDIPAMLREFSGRILDFQPDSWATHVSGHPPGATLVFVWLDRIGLGGPEWAAVTVLLVGGLAAVAVPVTLAALGSPDAARTTMPFLVLFPGAVWLGVSADGLFTGVTASGIALLAVATRGFTGGHRYAIPSALGAGLLLGYGMFLSYGLVVLGVIALAVVVLGRGGRAFGYAVPAALAVVAVFAAAGFWWLEGYHLVVERYYQGIASERPYGYWVWANLAALTLCAGPAVAAGVRRVASDSVTAGRTLPRQAVLLLVLAAGLAVTMADLSGLSKAETERIWLPFAVWLLPATALLPAGSRRGWLAVQAVTALAVNHLVLTIW